MAASNVVRIELLTKENFDTWKIQMEAILTKNDAWGFVNGEKPRPEIVQGDAASVAAVRKWENEDKKAKADIILSIQPSELKQIKGCETSREVWSKLKSIYQSSGPARKATLLKQLTRHKMADGDDVREHLRKFFDTVDKLSEMEVQVNRDLLTVMLLYSLPSTFENFRCAIESRDELPELEALRVKIVEEHDARKSETNDTEANAMLARKSRPERQDTSQQDASTEKYVSKGRHESFKYRCFRCKRIGHKASDCTASREREDSLYAETTIANVEAKFASSNVRWCLDSGCTSHMGNDDANFGKTLKSCSGSVNLAGEKNSAPIQGKGSVRLATNVDGQSKNVNVGDVLRVPELRTNLLSVGKITDKDRTVIFQKEKAEVIDRDGRVVLIADRHEGLYYVREAHIEHREEANIADKTDKGNTVREWHRRMGHLNFHDLVECDREGTVRGMQLGESPQKLDCDVCLRGKMTRSTFPESSTRKAKPLEIIHSDVIGPMRVESNGKARYVITFIDDYSRWAEIRLLRRKDEALNAFKEYKSLVENRHGCKIQFLQSDNGKEYLNESFDAYLRESGIQRRLTVTYTPEQNGVAERRNRTLMDMTRCLLIQSRLPPSFWGEAMNAANYIRNRCPSRSLKGKTAHEKWTGRVPDVSHLREFGSRVFVVDRRPSRGKLEPRSKEGIFIGYSEVSKAYRIWLPDERRVNIARDVKFLGVSDATTENECSIEALDRDDEDSTGIDVIFPTASQPEEDLRNRAEDEFDQQDVLEGDDVDPPRRGRGRPRIERTGMRGRPKKVYQEANFSEESAYIAEVPLEQAVRGPCADEWREAIASEIKSIIKNDTWIITERPKDRGVIGSRIVLRNKIGHDGNLVRRKARLVARGFSQRPGIDFCETFAPVARMGSIRTMMALAAEHGMTVNQFDITTAYLHGVLEEKVFMEVPRYTVEALKTIVETESHGDIKEKAAKMLDELAGGNKVCELKKALYGLRQAGRCWYERIDEELSRYGAKKSSADPCVYFKGEGNNLLLICIYVDDILVASRNSEEIADFGRHLSSAFEVTNLGVAKYCLGVEFTQRKGEITVSQVAYIKNILERFNMKDSKSVSTPLDPGANFGKGENEPCLEEKKLPYRELIGALMYLAVCSRPDIAYAVSCLSQFNSCFRREHWVAAKRVLRYLHGTQDVGLRFHRTGKPLEGFVDADWANCPNDRKSYTGFIFTLAGSPITWESRKQRTVALSSTEAEYMALSEATKEATHLKRLLDELGLAKPGAVRVFCDNNGARKLAENPVFHNRSKHIDVRHHYVREALENGVVEIMFTPTADMAADVLTKGLPKPKHTRCLDLLGMVRTGVPIRSGAGPLGSSVAETREAFGSPRHDDDWGSGSVQY